MVDGASTDQTLDIARNYQDKHPFIHVISEKDRGVYDAMNKGVAAAKGEWIYFLGSDDRLKESNTLHEVFSRIYASNVNLIYGEVQFKYSGLIYNGLFDLHKLIFSCNICHQAIFYHRSVFDHVGLYDDACTIFADRDFNIRCFRHPKVHPVFIPQVIAVYNEEDGLSAKAKDDAVFRKKQETYVQEFNSRPVQKIRKVFHRLKAAVKRLSDG